MRLKLKIPSNITIEWLVDESISLNEDFLNKLRAEYRTKGTISNYKITATETKANINSFDKSMINPGTSRLIGIKDFYTDSDEEESLVAEENHIIKGESVIVYSNEPFISWDDLGDAVPVKNDVKG